MERATASTKDRESHGGIVLGTMNLSDATSAKRASQNKNHGGQKINTIKEEIKRFGDDTTFHGVRLATDYRLNRYRRLLWLAIVGVMSGYLVFGVVISIQTYFKYPVTSIVKITHTPAVEFPAVTFCNFNWWRTSKISPELNRAIRSLNADDDDTVNAAKSMESIKISNMSDQLLVFGHQIEDMLMLCTFKGQKCSAANFTQVITDFGLCYSFNDNTESELTIHESGSHNSLFMQINLEQDEYLPGRHSAAGIKLLVHPQGQRPLVRELGIAISPGFETLVGLQLTEIISLQAPYASNCTDEALKYSKSFTVPLCQNEHMVDMISNKCGCRDLRYPGNSRECTLSEYYNCLLPAQANFTAADKSLNCRVPCKVTVYEPRISFAYWPGQHQADDIMVDLNMSESAIRKNLLQVRIYFEEISYRRTEEISSYSFLDLQSSIGGYMGLLIGASLITLFEFLDFILVTVATHLAGADEDRSKNADINRK